MAESVAVPIVELTDGRKFIADEQVQNDDTGVLVAFINRFPDFWTHDPWIAGWVSPKKERHDG